LAQIIQNESGKDDGEPAEADRQAAEMAHIGIIASAPVRARKAAPSTAKPIAGGECARYISAWCGLSAPKMPGAATMPRRPSTAITTNHISMTGPKRLPMKAVPFG
jgi:hypothetical protein